MEAVGISMGLAGSIELVATVLFIALLWAGGCIRAPTAGQVFAESITKTVEDHSA